MLDQISIQDAFTAADFEKQVIAKLNELFATHRIVILCGGTGLYIRALLRGLDPAPPADPEFRLELAALAAREGRPALHARLNAEAPAVARRLHPNDHVRVVRALEVARAGGSVSAQTRWRESGERYGVTYFGLTMDRRALARRLESRASAFVAAGLAAEVERLLARGYDASLPSMQSIGYREFARVARGALSVPEALRLMQRDTVRYAKRQWTWFAREPEIAWIDVEKLGGAERVADEIAPQLERSLAGR